MDTFEGRAFEGRTHYASPSVAVVVPLAQSVITGVLVGFGVGALSWLVGSGQPVKVGLAIWLVCQGCTWLVMLVRWSRLVDRIETALERFLGVGVEQPGEPITQIEPIRVEILDRPARRTTFIDLPARPEQLLALSDGLARGVPLAEGSWTGAGRPFSKTEFHTLRDAMLKGGLLVPKNANAPAQGFQLTAAGRHLIKQCAPAQLPPRAGPGQDL